MCFCSARTVEVLDEFRRLYEQQYAVALFNKVRYDVEGGGGPQPQLLHRKVTAPSSLIPSFSVRYDLLEVFSFNKHFYQKTPEVPSVQSFELAFCLDGTPGFIALL